MTTQRKKQLFFSFLLLVTAIIWGGGFVAVKNSLDYLSTLYLLAFRFTIGSIGMFLVFAKKIQSIRFSDIKCGAVLGLFMFIAFTFQIYAISPVLPGYTTVGKNSFLTATYMVLVPLFCWIILHRRPKLNSLFATLLCMIGIGLLSLDSQLSMKTGDVFTLICACFYALHIVFSQIYMEKKHDAIILVLLQLSFAALYSWIGALIFDPFPAHFLHTDSLVGILYLGIGCTMLAFLFQMIGQKHTNPTVASLLLSTESVFGCLFSVLLLHESVSGRMIWGCLLIFIALLLSDVGIDFKQVAALKNHWFKGKKA